MKTSHSSDPDMPVFLSHFCTMLRREHGSVAAMTGILMTLMVPGIIGAIDLTNITKTKSTAQFHLDSALVAASRFDDLEEADKDGLTRERGTRFLLNALRNAGIEASESDMTFEYDKDSNLMDARVEIAVPTLFVGKVFDVDKVVLVSQLKPKEKMRVEIALSLDASGSMNWEVDSNATAPLGSRRMDVLREGVDSLMQILETNDLVDAMVSVVPYSSSVNVSSTKIEGAHDWVAELATRSGRGGYKVPANPPAKDAVPTRNNGTPATAVLPMTKAKDAKDFFATIQPGGGTAGHIGAEWAYYSLLPDWSDLWDHKEKPRVMGEKNRKILVIMTDGDFTVTQTTGMTIDDAYDMFQDVCREARKEGMMVFTVGLKASAKTDDELSRCAKDPGNYFPVSDRSGMKAAFEAIGTKATKMRLTQ